MDVIHSINYCLDIAQSTMEHGTCLHRNYGVIIVRNCKIISSGYSCIIEKRTVRLETSMKEKLNTSYHADCAEGSKDGCVHCSTVRILHAEAMAIDTAPRELLSGATLYLVGRDMQTGKLLVDTSPCIICMRLIIKAGIAYVISRISPEKYNIVCTNYC